MAWKTPRTLTSPSKNSKDDSSFPGLKPPGPDATTKIEYEELQRNEIFALEAIYGDDFIQHTAAHSAWKVFRPSFSTLLAHADLHMHLEVRPVFRHTNKSPE